MSIDPRIPSPSEIVDFWLGSPEPGNSAAVMAMVQRLSATLDDEIRERFGALVQLGFDGGLTSWEKTPEDLVALILVLDQFPRHIFRGTAKQYEGGPRALRLALAAVDAGWLSGRTPLQRIFLSMPLVHSESLEVQRKNLVIADGNAASCPAWFGAFAAIGPAQARKYIRVIEKFGRFPHRNAMLGRENTEAEQAWLDAGNAELMSPDVLREPPATE